MSSGHSALRAGSWGLIGRGAAGRIGTCRRLSDQAGSAFIVRFRPRLDRRTCSRIVGQRLAKTLGQADRRARTGRATAA